MKAKCETCGKKFEKLTPYHLNCNSCIDKKNKNKYKKSVIDVPLKGSSRWYKEGWFKKNDKEWHNDIKSRVAQPNGDVIRVNHRGERIG